VSRKARVIVPTALPIGGPANKDVTLPACVSKIRKAFLKKFGGPEIGKSAIFLSIESKRLGLIDGESLAIGAKADEVAELIFDVDEIGVVWLVVGLFWLP